MSPVYLNPQHSSTIPFLELKGDQQQNLPTIMGYVHDHVTNTNTTNNTYNYNNYFSGSNLSNRHSSIDFLAMDYTRCTQEKIVEKLILSHDKHITYPYDSRDHKVELVQSGQNPKKCKPTKLRIMQRTATATTTATKSRKISGDHHDEQPKQSNRKSRNEANGIRMCTDCHTTTTPLWRSGPHGPKSLCNACGIRQRKARRAAAMATAELAKAEAETEIVNSPMSSSTTFETPKHLQAIVVDDTSSKIKLDHDKIHTLPLKKRCKNFNNDFWTYNNDNNDDSNNNNTNTNCQNDQNNYFEDYSKATSSQRVFLKDEEEGAILLMELSCGMGCSS